jgi:hypothetical protein
MLCMQHIMCLSDSESSPFRLVNARGIETSQDIGVTGQRVQELVAFIEV